MLFVVAALLSPVSSYARERFYHPLVYIDVGHSQNPTLRSDDEEEVALDELSQEDFQDQNIFLIGTEVQFGSESESDAFTIDFNAEARRYNNEILDSETLGALAGYRKFEELSTFIVEGGISQDDSIESEFEDTGRILTDTTRNTAIFNSSIERQLSENMSGLLGIEYQDVSFDSNSASAIDYSVAGINLGLDRTITERFSVTSELEFLKYEPGEEILVGEIEDEAAVSLLVGIEYRLSPIDILSMSAGLSDRKTTTRELSGSSETTDTDEIYRVELSRTGEQNSLTFGVENSLEGSSAGGLAETQRIDLEFGRLISPRVSFNVSTSYLKRNPIREDLEEREFFEFAPGLTWQVTRFLSLTFDARYLEQTTRPSDAETEFTADSTSFLVGARYDWGRKLIRR